MNKTQKGALYGVLLSLLLAGIVIFDVLDTVVGWPTKLLVSAVWGGLLLVPIYFIARKKDPREVDMDERDKQIIKRALLASFILLGVTLGVTYTVAFFIFGLKGSISFTMYDLSAVIYIVLVIFVLVLSLSVLIQYGLGMKEKNHE